MLEMYGGTFNECWGIITITVNTLVSYRLKHKHLSCLIHHHVSRTSHVQSTAVTEDRR